MSGGENGKPTNDAMEKERIADEKNDILILLREELDKKAVRKCKDRAMHRERREREALEKKRMPTKERGRKQTVDEEPVVETEEEKQLRMQKCKLKIVEESLEIKDLRQQIELAYTRKELGAQLKEKRQEEEKLKEQFRTWEANETARLMKEEEDHELELKQNEMKKKLEYRKVLQDQMINRYKEKQEKYKQMLKERALLDDALRTILEEEQMELRMAVERKQKCKKEIDAFKQAKAIWTLREKEVEEEEERQISDYFRWKDEMIKEQKRKERNQQEELDRNKLMTYNIVKQTQMTSDEEETKRILEYERKRDEMARQKMEDDIKMDAKVKKELREAFARQVDDKLTRLRLQKQEDTDYLMQKIQEFEEDKKYQQMTAQKKRRLKHELRLCLLKELEEKQYRRKLEEEELIRLKEFEENEGKERRIVEQEERIRLLQEHTGKLIGCLPPGFLRPSDFPYLPKEVRDFYSAKPQSTTVFGPLNQ